MIKEHITKSLNEALKSLKIDESAAVERPNNMDHGDYTTTIALKLAKLLKKNPMEIAESIAKAIQTDDVISKVEVLKPGFVNFWVNKNILIKNLEKITNQKENYGKNDTGNNKTVIVEFSSPNIAKPFTIGHLRSTIIGEAIANLLETTGWNVKRDNHVGDWGTQFGKQIYAIKTWGNVSEIENSEHPVKLLVALYVKFHDEAEKNPELEDEGRKWFKKLEDGDGETHELWQKCIDWSWKEFDRIYIELGISGFENNGRGYGESYFEDKMEPVIEELKKQPFYKDSEGAKLVFFPKDELPPLMIIKKDGATLYSTRDLATDKFRIDKYGKDVIIINEVGMEQSLYFKQLYKTEELLGWFKPGQRVHIGHGMYRFKDKKMSTRKGNVIWLEEVLKEAQQRALDISPHKLPTDEVAQNFTNPSSKHILTSTEYVYNAKHIGIGAIKWNDLKRAANQDIVFDWDDILNMQGDSGPYMQYTYVRCLSILKDQKIFGPVENPAELSTEETVLMRMLQAYPETVSTAAKQYSPNIICNYLLKLAQQFNLFYQKHNILKSKEATKMFRLSLTAATAQVIKNGLNLLGIQTVEKM